MIDINDGELIDILPSQLKKDPDMICFSYALKRAAKKILRLERETMTQNYIEYLPESILDVLAVELRTPYYTQELDIGVKRDLIKNSLIWHTKAGTVSAVSEMVRTIFGEGNVVEWMDFTEGEKTPGMFDIKTNAVLTPDAFTLFTQIVERVKNARSHLRRIITEREFSGTALVAGAAAGFLKETVSNSTDRIRDTKKTVKVCVAMSSSPEICIGGIYGSI